MQKETEIAAQEQRIVMLVGPGETARIMYHGLADEAKIIKVIMEDKTSLKTVLSKRVKKLGIFTVFGQLLFIAYFKVTSRFAKARQAQIIADLGLNLGPIPEELVQHVTSVNGSESIKLLQDLKPDVIVVNGTRIISKKVLNSVKSTFVNTHLGITPRYRGVYGGYWAVYKGDYDNIGLTVHLVDPGIDTGGILGQARVKIEKSDSVHTYSLLQIGKAIPLIKQILKDLSHGKAAQSEGLGPSGLWSHPTIWQYLWARLTRGVK